MVKVLIAVASLLASLTGIKFAHEKGFFKRSQSNVKDEPSTCQACLKAGKDFCVSSNKCVPQGALHCKGPKDHITSDKKFALSGNPWGVQHSMVCPGGKAEGARVAKKSDWNMCIIAKTRCMKDGKKVLDGRCGMAWEKCGKEIEKHDSQNNGKKDVDTKDCYFDKECHAKVNWEEVGKIKAGFFGRLKILKKKESSLEHQHLMQVKEMMDYFHKMFADAGMPDDRIDFTLTKWVKSVYPEVMHETQEEGGEWKMCTAAKKRCMKDGNKVLDGRCGMVWEKCGEEVEAHKKHEATEWKMCAAAKKSCMKDGSKVLDGRCGMAWEKCGEEMKAHKQHEGTEWKMCGAAKEKCMKDGKKVLDGRCGMVWEKCGEEVKAHKMNKKGASEKDCYFDKECHAKVDWDKVGEIKNGFFARLKSLKLKEETKEKEDAIAIKDMMEKVHEMFVSSGVPDDRVDYILLKWVKSVYPEVLENIKEDETDRKEIMV